jgi:hypothetical protein
LREFMGCRAHLNNPPSAVTRRGVASWQSRAEPAPVERYRLAIQFCGLQQLYRVPAFLKLHRGDIAQRRVSPSVLVERHQGRLITRAAARVHFLPVQQAVALKHGLNMARCAPHGVCQAKVGVNVGLHAKVPLVACLTGLHLRVMGFVAVFLWWHRVQQCVWRPPR